MSIPLLEMILLLINYSLWCTIRMIFFCYVCYSYRLSLETHGSRLKGDSIIRVSYKCYRFYLECRIHTVPCFQKQMQNDIQLKIMSRSYVWQLIYQPRCRICFFASFFIWFEIHASPLDPLSVGIRRGLERGICVWICFLHQVKR